MSWQDRDYAGDAWRGMGRPGGDWRGIRASLDNPMTWSIPMGRVAGVTVKIHLLFILFIVVEILRAKFPPGQSVQTPVFFALTLVWLGSLWLMVLLHEFGHIAACRMTGGEGNEILMWPLGGLAYCLPPHQWKAHLITVVGGPAVNVVFLFAVTITLGLITGKWAAVALPNPFDGGAGLWEIDHSYALMSLYELNRVNMLLVMFNLLPMFPFDGGRIFQSIMWRWIGYSRSMKIAVRVGYVGAIAMAVYGLVTQNPWMISIALFGGITCYMTFKQLQWTDSEMGFETDEYALSLHQGAEPESGTTQPAINKRAERMARREQQEAQEVDRILQKIAESGIDSLSRGERALLKRVTERKRQSG